MTDVGHFFAMGGYARFVWPAYALWAAVIAANIWSAGRALDRARTRALRRLAARATESDGSRS
jgi:heme exporter protein CcmD